MRLAHRGSALFARLAVLSCLSFPPFSTYAADIYRWVDDSGRTHFSDSVPEQYKKSATKIDSRRSEVSSEQRREAEERAEREQARIKALQDDRARANLPDATQAGPLTSPKPSAGVAANCEELYRRYRESLACFAPYVMANGATKAEAYSKCTVVNDPSSRCGPPRSEASSSRTY